MPVKKVKKIEVKKKEAKKIAPKTAFVRKTTSREILKKKPLVMVSGDTCFWVNNGPALQNMQDLRDALRTMTEEQFSYHTGMGRNDFSAWVLGVLGDKKCASALLKAKSMEDALSVVEKSLKAYSV